MRRVLVVLLLLGCSAKKKEEARAGDAEVVKVTADAGVPTRDARARTPTLVPRDAVEAFVARWLDVQNKGDFAAYAALYADGFRGVRRSGKQTVRMDRAKWLADRKRMFGRPMRVTATDLAITVSSRGAIVRFVQEWESGKYHDVGPKQLELETQPGGALAIVREEMLASEVVGKAPATTGAPQVWPVNDGAVVLTDAAPLDWGIGSVSLDQGEYREPDPDLRCEEDPPDYEAEQDRYWSCHDASPHNAYDYWIASRAADPRKVPPEHAAWIGKSVRIGGGKAPCVSKVKQLRLVGEWEATMGAVTGDGPTEDEAIAKAVLAKDRILVAAVDGRCDGSWAVLADAPAPVAWTITAAPPDLAQRALAALHDVDGYLELLDEKPAVVVIAGPDGRRLVLATRDGPVSCMEPGGMGALFEVGKRDELTRVFDDLEPFGLADAIDASGDGWPELALADGVLVRDPDGAWDRWQPIDFPDEVGDCYCACE